jgi:hypothetical protein
MQGTAAITVVCVHSSLPTQVHDLFYQQEKPILGIRYHCQDSDCMDFNLCGKCVDAGVHPAAHTLLRLSVASSEPQLVPDPQEAGSSVPSQELETNAVNINAEDEIVHDGFSCNICKVRPTIYPLAMAHSSHA